MIEWRRDRIAEWRRILFVAMLFPLVFLLCVVGWFVGQGLFGWGGQTVNAKVVGHLRANVESAYPGWMVGHIWVRRSHRILVADRVVFVLQDPSDPEIGIVVRFDYLPQDAGWDIPRPTVFQDAREARAFVSTFRSLRPTGSWDLDSQSADSTVIRYGSSGYTTFWAANRFESSKGDIESPESGIFRWTVLGGPGGLSWKAY